MNKSTDEKKLPVDATPTESAEPTESTTSDKDYNRLETMVRQRTAELEKANKELSEIKAQFEAVYNHHYQLTGLIDVEGRLLMGNRTALKFAGIKKEDFAGKLFWETPWWTHSQHEQNKLRDAMNRALQGEMVNFETSHISATGETRNIDFRISPAFNDQGEVIYLVPEGYDITERKKAEEALRKSEEKYRTFFQNSRDPMFMLRKGMFLDCNAAAVALLGYQEAEEVIGLRPSDFSPEYQPDGKKTAEKAKEMIEIAFREGTNRFEWEHKTKNGELFPVEVSLTAVPSEGETILLALWRDISDQKRAEQERQHLEEQLRQSQKMEAIGQLAGGVAHDFNNLLQAIIGHGEMALDLAKPTDPIQEVLDVVMKASDRASVLVNLLLAFSRKQVLKLDIFDLNEVVEELAKMIRRLIGAHIVLTIDTQSSRTLINADRGQMEQILMNLCVNARDAMFEGGNLTIRTECTVLDADFCQRQPWATPGHYALLSMSDTGDGMDEKTLQRVFEPFFTTKEEGKGTGLGLSTVYGIVRQHNGIIDVQSELGKGTCFKIYLPLSKELPQAKSKVEQDPQPRGTEFILLAEDDEFVRNLTQQFLENAGYSVLTANDGAEAIQLFNHHRDELDLALLDMVMPKCGGNIVHNHIRKVGAQTKVLFTSAYSALGSHAKIVSEKKPELLKKPYKRGELLRMVRNILDS